MIRWKLPNKLPRDRSEKSRNDYKKQRNLSVTLLRRAKQQYFFNLDPNLVADNKMFLKSVKPLFSDEICHKKIINLTGNGKVLTQDLEITFQ